MAMQEVSRQPGPALTHEHCMCVAQLQESNERLRRDSGFRGLSPWDICDRERTRLLGAIESTWRPEVKALRARNDELRAENEQWRTDWLNMQAENEKSLAIAYPYRSESDAEIEQLRGELHRVAESRRGQRERAERAEAESE